MLLGMLFGSINYLAGLGISINHETILKMMSFTPQGGSIAKSTQTTASDAANGTTTTTITIEKEWERKKDFLSLNTVSKDWPTLFNSQQYLSLILPYVYLFFLEAAVALSLSLTMNFVNGIEYF